MAQQWRSIRASLPESWSDARLTLTISDADRADEAASFLGPLMPSRNGALLRFYAARRADGPSAGAVERALARLDEEGVEGRLELLGSGDTPAVAPAPSETLTTAWDAEIAALPTDWSDVYAELQLSSTDHLDRAALLAAPINPARIGEKPAFRFRCARRFGYGASEPMVRRCLERLDGEGIRGEVRVLRALSDSKPVGTQGPVWYLGGKAV